METKISDLKQRLERRDQEKEKEREEILKVTRQQKREREKDEFVKQPKANLQLNIQSTFIEREKTEVQRVVPVVVKDPLTEIEKRKINIYFRNRIFSLSKLVEDKVRNNSIIGKGGKGFKAKQLTTIPSTTSILSPSGKAQIQANYSNVRSYSCIFYIHKSKDPAVLDEVWKIIKAVVSTKSRYKYRDVVNYHKKVREAIKNLGINFYILIFFIAYYKFAQTSILTTTRNFNNQSCFSSSIIFYCLGLYDRMIFAEIKRKQINS